MAFWDASTDEKLDKILEAYRKVMKAAENQDKFVCHLFVVNPPTPPFNGERTVLTEIIWLGTEPLAEAKKPVDAFMAPLTSIPQVINAIGEVPYTKVRSKNKKKWGDRLCTDPYLFFPLFFQQLQQMGDAAAPYGFGWYTTSISAENTDAVVSFVCFILWHTRLIPFPPLTRDYFFFPPSNSSGQSHIAYARADLPRDLGALGWRVGPQTAAAQERRSLGRCPRQSHGPHLGHDSRPRARGARQDLGSRGTQMRFEGGVGAGVDPQLISSSSPPVCCAQSKEKAKTMSGLRCCPYINYASENEGSYAAATEKLLSIKATYDPKGHFPAITGATKTKAAA